MLVVPKLKHYQKLSGLLLLSNSLDILINDFNNSNRLIKTITTITNKWPSLEKTTKIAINYDNSLNEEAYLLVVDEQGIKICSKTDVGAFYAFTTLNQLINQEGIVPCCEIKDEPDLKIRGFMMDISRAKVPKLDTIKKIIDLLSVLKYNHLELYVEGFSLESTKYPKTLESRNYLTFAEYEEVEKYAYEHFIDLVPNENGFGHMQDWLLLDEFKHLSEVDDLFEMWGSKRTSSTLDVTNPESVELVKSLYDDFLPHSKSKYFNMNFDEPFELGHGKSKEYVEKVGIGNAFVDYFMKLYDHVKKYDKIPMIWGDVLLKHPEAIKRLPKDVIFIDWGYNLDYPYYKNLKLLSELGVKFMTAPATSTWGVITSRYLDMITTIRNACYYTREYNGEGMLLTDWGDLGHLQYLPYSYPGIIYGAMCSWNINDSPEPLIKDVLERLVDQKLAGAILDLSTYTRLEGSYRSYGSKLFSSILHSEGTRNEKEDDKLAFFLNKMRYNVLSYDEAYALELEFNAIKKRIISSNDLGTLETLEAKEILGSIELLITLLNVNVMLKAYFDKEIDPEQLDNCIFSLTNYLSVHHSLWVARNKEEGYAFSALRLQQLIDILKKLKFKLEI